MQVKKKKLNLILKNLNDKEFVPFFNRMGYEYKKTTKRFIKKKDKLDLTVSHMLESIENYVIDEEGNFYLISILSSAICTNDFRKWNKKHFNELDSFDFYIGNVKFYTKIEQDIFNQDDFYEGGDSTLFKKRVSKLISGTTPSPEFYNLEKGLKFWEEKHSTILELNANWNFIWENRKFSEKLNMPALHLLIYLDKMEEAKTGYFEIMKNFINYLNTEQINKLPSWQITNYKNWINTIEKEYNQYFSS